MANISEASGYITFDGPWSKEQIEKMLYVLYSQDEGSDYNTQLIHRTIKEDIDSVQQSDPLKFYGSGRWSYTYNLEAFNNWTDLSEDSYKYTRAYREGLSYEDFCRVRRDIRLEMVRHKLSLLFDFADIEVGMSMAYKASVEISAEYYYDTTTGTSEAQFVTYSGINEQSYECNMKFLCEEVRDDDEQLYGFLDEYIVDKNFKFKDKDHQEDVLNRVGHVIQKHEEWYNIPAYPDIESFEEYHKEIAEKIDNLINRFIKETS